MDRVPVSSRPYQRQQEPTMILQRYSLAFQQEADTTIAALERLQAAWPAEVGLDLETKHSVFAAYPYLFLEAFPTLTPEQVRPLALAGRLFANALMLSDMIMDHIEVSDSLRVAPLRLQAAQLECYQLLYQLFPPQSRFWQYWH